MGLFCSGVIVKGPTQQGLLRYLKEQSRLAFVSVTIDGVTAIFDNEFHRGHVVAYRCNVQR